MLLITTLNSLVATLTALPAELRRPALDHGMTTLTQYWVWAGGHAVVGLNFCGEVVCVFSHADLKDGAVQYIWTAVGPALSAFGLESRVADAWEVARSMDAEDPRIDEITQSCYGVHEGNDARSWSVTGRS